VSSFLMMATKMNQYPDFPQCRKLQSQMQTINQ
jgi:hypothetical protein